MAKFLKSIFQSDTRRAISYDGTGSEEEHRSNDVSPTMEVRRKLSISRSGRMRQAQKKRLSLSMDIYGGETDLQPDKPKAVVEYHVSQKTQPRENPLAKQKQRRRSGDSMSSTDSGKIVLKEQGTQITAVPKVTKKGTDEVAIPDEEIDSAFEVIEKTL